MAAGPSSASRGRIVGAEEAQRIGLLNAVLPTDGFRAAAIAWCQQISRHPGPAVFAAKRAVVEGLRGSLDDGLRLEGQLFLALNASEDAKARNAAVSRTASDLGGVEGALMEFDLMTGGLPLRRMQDLARDAQAAGFSGLVVTESGRTAYLGCAAAALAADLDLLTGVAVAFPRSPMVTASVAWELAEASGGRFRLGLGTQVKAHIERRYGSEFEHPGPRLREYVAALRAIFAAFRGEERLAHEGEFWNLSLLPAMWSPGSHRRAGPAHRPRRRQPVDAADGGRRRRRRARAPAQHGAVPARHRPPRAGRGCRERRTFARGPRRDRAHLRGAGCHHRTRCRPSARWPGCRSPSTGRRRTTPSSSSSSAVRAPRPAIREKQKAGDLAGMAAVIDDDLLEHFCVSGDWATVADGLIARHQGVATRVVSYFAGMAWARDPATLGPWGELARAVRAA